MFLSVEIVVRARYVEVSVPYETTRLPACAARESQAERSGRESSTGGAPTKVNGSPMIALLQRRPVQSERAQ